MEVPLPSPGTGKASRGKETDGKVDCVVERGRSNGRNSGSQICRASWLMSAAPMEGFSVVT